MRILFLSHYYPPEVNAPASRTAEHCARWANEHDVTVVTCAPNCPDGVVFDGYRNRLRRQISEENGVTIVRVWTYVAPNAGTIRRIFNYLSYLVSAVWTCLTLPRPDVVIATSPQFFCGWAGVWVSRLRRCPFVLEIRDIWPESIEAVGAMQRGMVLRGLEWLEKRMYLAADHIVAVGGGYRDRILRKASVADRTTVIMNGVDLDKFSELTPEAATAFRQEWNLGDRFVCSYIGTIGMAHGLEVVIESASQLKEQGRKDVVFCLVGDGARRKELEALARQAGVEELVVFTGRQPRERMPEVISASDVCLVHLRDTELFGSVIPSKIFETMAMARPILMGVRGEARELVIQSGAGLAMEPGSASDLLTSIEELADNPAARRDMGIAGREFVAENFSRDALAAKYRELLEVIAGGRRAPVATSTDTTTVATPDRAACRNDG